MAHPGLNNDCDLTLERAISELGTLNIAASSSQFGSSARNQSSYPISDLRSLPISSANTTNNVNNANTRFHLEKRLVQFNTLARFQPSSPKAALISPERDTPLSDVEADFEGAESESEEENMHRTQTLGYQEEISRLKQEIKTLKEKQEQLMLEEKIRLHKIRELYQKNESESNRANHLEEKLKKVDGINQSLQEHLQCQICLEILKRPWTLTPCGHVGCLHCLVSWFSMAHARDDTPDLVSRPKTCPQCRVVVTNRPTPSFTLRNLIEELQSAGVIERHPESSTGSNNDPWAGIFADIPSIQQPEQHVGPQVEEPYQLEEYVGVHDPDANDDVLSIDSPSESSEYRLEFEARREHLDQVMDWEIEVRNENTRGWTSPQWEPPRFSSGTIEVTGDDVARLDRTRMEITSLLNRGATKEMIARYRLSYGHGYGIIMEKGSLYIQLGWNISRNASDLEGRIYVGHVLYEMRNHPERYAFSEPDRLGIRDVLRLVPILTEVEDYFNSQPALEGESQRVQ